MQENNSFRFDGVENISANYDNILSIMTDESALSKIFPGVKSIKKIEENAYFMSIKTPFWGLPGDIWARLELECHREKILNKVKGSGVGSTFELTISIEALDKRTDSVTIKWVSDLVLNGRINNLPRSVIDRTSRKIIKKVVTNLQNYVQNADLNSGEL